MFLCKMLLILATLLDPLILDMVHNNPGEEPYVTKYNDPAFLKSQGFNGSVTHWHINCAVSYPGVKAGKEEKRWIEAKAGEIESKLAAFHAEGLRVFPFTDFIVFPRSVWEKYGDEITGEGTVGGTGGSDERARRPNLHSERTQQLLREQIDAIFRRFPTLDGLTLRFGETYLHDTPFHMGGNPIAGGEAGIDDHIFLINLLRDEICVKRGKMLIYRTWDFGYNFHNNPQFYQRVTSQVEPHPNLVFSIKYQQDDYHRMTPFNPSIGLGRHGQIVESQSRMEAYGKGAHPYYTAKGVIEGWPETEYEIELWGHRFTGRRADPEAPRGVRDILGKGTFRGVMTWSNGGGWQGPYITHEIWTDLNTFVVAQWAIDPTRSEEEIFARFADSVGLHGRSADLFREIALTSVEAVRKGHCNSYASNNLWWTRDEFFCVSDCAETLRQILAGSLEEKVLAEKAESAAMWRRIEALARQIDCDDSQLLEAIKVSCSYGRIKYELIEQMWQLMIEDAHGTQADRAHIAQTIARYDELWSEWRQLKESSRWCATLYTDLAFRNRREGSIGELVDKWRSSL